MTEEKKYCGNCRWCNRDKRNPAKMGLCLNIHSKEYHKAVRTNTVIHCPHWEPRQWD